MKNIYATPKNWLTLADCGRTFKNFKKALENLGEPIPDFETRFLGKLESILESVRQTFGGEYLNATVLDAAAAYFNQVIRGHPFRNGNKRMAVLFTHYFLLTHNVDYTLSYNELFYFAITVAKAGEHNISGEQTRMWCREILERFTQDAK
ncbi:TPA: hypothetical protein DIV55_05485 [Patescibacteria group bacterium]|uniref:Death-on-curing family protein n=1 Tax=Candidatus Gottesmanbacteria bacterium GW2011_GWA1_43_11 TaxID=1618436 RepID=A0A0G1F8W8_9BACT|nr:MAG: Death-on-curing family protein [Candidatus Gottesmanbacteria bacterium GW2011_GWA1_43_11]HCS79162.1 hypothetical protein [Patescibacteria group bacterium]